VLSDYLKICNSVITGSVNASELFVCRLAVPGPAGNTLAGSAGDRWDPRTGKKHKYKGKKGREEGKWREEEGGKGDKRE